MDKTKAESSERGWGGLKGNRRMSSGVETLKRKKKVCYCVTNWKEQGSNTGRVRGVIPTGASQSQKESGKDERALQNCVKTI